MSEVSDGEPTIKVPRVAIFIPGLTSRIRLEPRYVLPIYKAKFDPTIKDKSDLVRIIPIPKDFPEDSRWRILPASQSMEYEASRLRAEFGTVGENGTGIAWFDQIYPGDTFRDIFERTLAEKPNLNKQGMSGAEALIAGLDGIGQAYYRAVMTAGFLTVNDVARGDVSKLSLVLGPENAERAVDAALQRLQHSSLPTTANDANEEFVVTEKE